ncbi:MAG: DNA polymerase III subunit delta [Gammaproteobacteria bacterium]|nr:DNA polymerase III subunit delta [Gammaproteobacteria bacterium]MYF01498.1 DNA polymerase III subunit delta [Gammaproteobacteria bacterium]MYI77572.1 DNA polymerase III subunit delta [Gammaproteobacteria bacterium]
MIVTFDKFPQSLNKQLDPLYFLVGNELLLLEESVDLIVAEAETRGFAEIEHVEIAQPDEWYSLLADASGRSLFAEKRLFDVRLTKNVFTTKVQAALEEWIQDANGETIMILRGWSWDYRSRNAAWFKTISALATTVIIDIVPTAKLSHWIKDRAQALGLKLSEDAIRELADLTDGNLYAAQQELEKLRLIFLNEDKVVGIEELTRINWSISGAFDLVDAACNGNVDKLSTMLAAVRREGTQPLFLVGALGSQLRKYHDLACGRRTYLSSNRRRVGERVIKRIGRTGLERLLVECAHLDCQQKGILQGDSWLALESILLNLAGYQNRTLETDATRLRVDYEN